MAVSVLIIEDEVIVASGIKMHLEELSYRVLLAKNGTEGLSMAIDNRPDIVLLDIELPGIRGDVVLDEIRKRNIETRVIMVTGYHTDTDNVVKYIKAGACDYLLKPVNPAHLDEIIKKHMLLENTINLQVANPAPAIKKMFEMLTSQSDELKSLHLQNKQLADSVLSMNKKQRLEELSVKLVAVLFASLSVLFLNKIVHLSNEYLLLVVFVLLVLVLILPINKIKRVGAEILKFKTKIELRE